MIAITNINIYLICIRFESTTFDDDFKSFSYLNNPIVFYLYGDVQNFSNSVIFRIIEKLINKYCYFYSVTQSGEHKISKYYFFDIFKLNRVFGMKTKKNCLNCDWHGFRDVTWRDDFDSWIKCNNSECRSRNKKKIMVNFTLHDILQLLSFHLSVCLFLQLYVFLLHSWIIFHFILYFSHFMSVLELFCVF